MDDDYSLRAWLTLLRCPGVGSKRLRQLLDDANGHVHAALDEAKFRAHAGTRQYAWLKHPDEKLLDSDLRWLHQPMHHLLVYGDDDFPPQLEVIPDPPAALYIDGAREALLEAQIAMVGSRNVSHAGKHNTRLFASFLAGAFTVTSGLAQGVDGIAHQTALASAGHTIAVVGTGVDKVYPRSHTNLAERIRHQGALVSEFNLGTSARPGHFPRRNRIISGLSLGVIVIEASLRSGSLITARLAMEQGREVFAVPGSIHNPLAKGCHRLIRDGAQLLENVADITDVLAPMAHMQAQGLQKKLDKLPLAPTIETSNSAVTSEQARLLDAMQTDVAVAVDELSERSGLSSREVSVMLLMLELDGRVASEIDGRWVLLA